MFNKYLNNRFFALFFFPFVLGAMTTLSFEPFNLIVINFFIFPLFFYLITYVNKKSKSVYRKKPYKKNIFLLGLSFGFGFYLSGISWITNSLTFDENFIVLIPFALILIPLFLSLFIAFTVLLAGSYLRLNLSSIIIFSCSMAISDYVRAKILTGFPWNLWAYSTSGLNEILQIVNPIGLYAYNLIVITFFTLPIIIFFRIKLISKTFYITFASLIILGLYIYGNYEINKNQKLLATIEDKIFVKVIAPNFDLKYGLSVVEIEDRFKKLIRYSDPDKKKETFFIWPEGVFSGYSYKEIFVFSNLIKDNY